MEGKGEIFVDEANESGFDVLLFQIGHHALMELLAVAALKITEFHDGERCSSVSKAGFTFQQQISSELGLDPRLGFPRFIRGGTWGGGLQQQGSTSSKAKTKAQQCDRGSKPGELLMQKPHGSLTSLIESWLFDRFPDSIDHDSVVHFEFGRLVRC